MKFNAAYRYRNSGTSNVFVDGGACYIENANKEQLVDSDWGKDLVLAFTMYVRDKRKSNIDWGTVVEVNMQDGQQFICTVTGIDCTISRLYTFTVTNSSPTITANGSVKFKTKTGGGIDTTTGYPKAVTVAWSSAYDCHIVKSTENLQAKDNGEPIVDKSYTVYITQSALPSEQIELFDNSGVSLGEFSVISAEYIDTKGVLKIIV